MIKIAIFDLDDTLFDTTGQLNGSLEHIDTITLFSDAATLLNTLKERGIILALVSTGNRTTQHRKITTLAINHYFDHIRICEVPEDKLTAFKEIIEHYRAIDRKDVLIIGDRIDREIMYGNMLGCTTIRVCRGKWNVLVPLHRYQIPNFSVFSLEEFLRIVRHDE